MRAWGSRANIPAAESMVDIALVGREAEIAALTGLAARAADGRGGVALISGEAGMGKSRLVRELIARVGAGENPPLVLVGGCFEQDRSAPFAAIVDVLRRLTADSDMVRIGEIVGPVAADLAVLAPELGFLFPNAPSRPALDPEEEQRRIFAALFYLFSKVAGDRPLLLIVEDIHWSDSATLDFLTRLARQAVATRLLLVLTYRGDEISGSLAAAVADLERSRLAAALPLAPLSLDETLLLVGAIAGNGRLVRPGLVSAIHSLTEGNPFFIEEVIKATGGESTLNGDGSSLDRLRLPQTVLLAVQRQLDPLPADARRLLTIAAVAGRRFDFEVLHSVTGLPEGGMVDSVKKLIAARLVVEESADTFSFRHSLIRQAVYTDMLLRERRALHRSIGDAIQKIYPGDARWLADRSFHAFAAEDWETLIEVAPEAAERARQLQIPNAVVEQIDRATTAADRLGRSPDPAWLLMRGHAYEQIGGFDGALANYQAAINGARARGDSSAECQALLDLGWLWTNRDYARSGGYFERAVDLARSIGDPVRLASTLNRVGNWSTHVVEPASGLPYHLEALAVLRSASASGIDTRSETAATLDLLGITSFMRGDIPAGAAYYGEAVELWRNLEDRQGLATSLMVLALRRGAAHLLTIYCPPVALETVRAEAEEAIAAARAAGWRAGESAGLMYLASVLQTYGVPDLALANANHALVISEELEHRVWSGSAYLVLGALARDMLDLPLARRNFEAGLRLAEETGSSFLVKCQGGLLASVLVDQHLPEEAAALLDRISPESPGMVAIADRIVWAARAEIAAEQGDGAGALAIVDGLIATAPNVDESGGRIIPQLWLIRGRALIAVARIEEAEAALTAAANGSALHRFPAIELRARLALGTLHRTHRRRDAAATEFVRVREIAGDLAAHAPEGDGGSFLKRVESLLPPRGQPSERREAKAKSGGLTGREREVAALVGQGLSNKAAAAALFVSERTIEKHVENLLGKLGFSSRSQIAVWAAEHRLMDGN